MTLSQYLNVIPLNFLSLSYWNAWIVITLFLVKVLIESFDRIVITLLYCSIREICGKEDIDIAYKHFKAFYQNFSSIDKMLTVDSWAVLLNMCMVLYLFAEEMLLVELTEEVLLVDLAVPCCWTCVWYYTCLCRGSAARGIRTGYWFWDLFRLDQSEKKVLLNTWQMNFLP